MSKQSYPTRWDLTDLLKDPARDGRRLTRAMKREVKGFLALRQSLTSKRPAAPFRESLQRAERIARLTNTLGAYSHLWFSENTGSEEALALKAKIEHFLAEVTADVLFFDLWWQSLDDVTAAKLCRLAGDQRYRLDTLRRLRPHTLSEPEEKLLTIKNVTGPRAMVTIYDVLTNGFSFRLKPGQGKAAKALTREALAAYTRGPDPKRRIDAYRALFREFSRHGPLVGELYKTLVNDWKNEQVSMRKHRSPIAVRNLANDLPDEVVEVILKICRDNVPLFQKYFAVKARICGITRMNRFHLFAPFEKTQKRYRYQEAVALVLDAYRAFSPDLAEYAERVFRERHLDADIRKGKMGGAYCYSVVPGHTPYVMMNFRGQPRDVATLAHELGHAVHGMLAAGQSVFSFHATLPLAETASVFGERLLADRLMAGEKDGRAIQQLLVSQLDDLYATILRQAWLTQFEVHAHRMIGEGATTRDLCKTYLADLRGQLGPGIPVDDVFQWEWLTIPHVFHTPFYCYAYSFGCLLALALYRRSKQEGRSFVPRYLTLLAAGGSQSPDRLLESIGIDMRSSAFWQSGFDAIADMVDALERTVTSRGFEGSP